MNELDCFKCGKKLQTSLPGSTVYNQPSEGLVFISYGQYGSTVFDPMNDTYLELNICDLCVAAHKEHVLLVRRIRDVSFEYEKWSGE